MTVTQPSQDPNKDSATLVWEGEATNAINKMQHQIDNINQTVVTSTPRVAIYSHTSDGAIQSFTPPASGDGYVSYFAYTDELPTLPVSGIAFSAFSDDEIDFKIRQYIERAIKPTNPGTVTYNVANGSWLSSNNWTKTKLVRGATNVWYCEAHIVGTTGSITTKWSNPKLLYGGQTGSGILYYTTSATSAPGKPLADGYDFESGAFTNLRNAGQAVGGTNGWSFTPITVTIGGGTTVSHKHWQSVFNVEISELTEHTTQLDGGINDSVTTITVDSTAGFPIPSVNNTPLTIYIGSEQITYTGVTNTTFTGCVRGANSTTEAAHSDNDVVTTRLPVQIITFETPTGFVPIGSNLQSDNFNGDLSNGTQGTAGWGISRTGNAIFNGVQVRGSLNADDINAGTINASNVAVTNLNADNITTGDLSADYLSGGTIEGVTLNITGLTELQGAVQAPNLAVGVIMQTMTGSGSAPSSGSSGTVTFGSGGFTSSNLHDADGNDILTDLIVIAIAEADGWRDGDPQQGWTNHGTSVVGVLQTGGSTAFNNIVSASGSPYVENPDLNVVTTKIGPLAQNTAYTMALTYAQASNATSLGSGSVNMTMMEVRRPD